MSAGIKTMDEARGLVRELLDDLLLNSWQEDNRLVLAVEPVNLLETGLRLRNDEKLSCQYLIHVCGVDQGDFMETVYLLRSMSHPILIEIRIRLDHQTPIVPSVTHIWAGANWHERETYDLFGIRFDQHPDLRRLLNREDMDVFPLCKDARPHRPLRPEWRWEGLEAPRRLPGEPPRRQRS